MDITLPYRTRPTWQTSIPAAVARGECRYRGCWSLYWGPYFVDHRWVCLHDHATRDEAVACAEGVTP